MADSSSFEVTSLNKINRLGERGAYDKDTVYRILDHSNLICTISWCFEGQSYAMPMMFARDGDRILLHCSVATGFASKITKPDVRICFVVHHVDSIVYARYIFSHSCNYESVVAYGRCEEITDPDEKLRCLYVLSEHLVPDRWDHVRPANKSELKATAVIAMNIESASAKVRTGGPSRNNQDDQDFGETWGGLVHISERAIKKNGGSPFEPDPLSVEKGTTPPPHIQNYQTPINRD
eukprot:CAMPEP_0201476154 /NCGR_PEP_ID=MMETSP0151_2-20130828/1433_1 /ASSEMBLY_ACC=CAM_ASM_000257 /TAXON_ID=200890 /ORGANISM="Paramoeba atlantica, Strain 621/1 / CCAP 1560/9" /LENGTH=235 /DNA_ID=CAMNT_0047856443 /DNA_START=70 /DNA_END=777 /DNA_ORIENTATION=-